MHVFLQTLASIQPRTGPIKFARSSGAISSLDVSHIRHASRRSSAPSARSVHTSAAKLDARIGPQMEQPKQRILELHQQVRVARATAGGGPEVIAPSCRKYGVSF